jgi:hypothetical protein
LPKAADLDRYGDLDQCFYIFLRTSLSFFSDDIAPGLYYKYMNSPDVVSLAKVNTARKKMLKSIIRSASLAIVAVIGFSSVPAFADGNTCEGSCGRTRACQYTAKELSLNAPAVPTPTADTPAPLVDPPVVNTPAPAPVEQPPATPTRPRGLGRVRGRG